MVRRVVIVGAGAVGGVLAGYLAKAGHPVVLVEQDPQHRRAIELDGLRFRTFTSNDVFRLPVVAKPSDVDFADGDVAIVAVKAFDSAEAYAALASTAGRSLPVFSAQNGMGNDAIAADYFDDSNGIVVLFNGTRLLPGEVTQTFPGLNEIGSYPTGVGASAQALLELFETTLLPVKPTECLEVMRWNKLLLNLSNPISALLGRPSHEVRGDLAIRAFITEVYGEGRTVLEAAGIRYADDEGAGGFEERLRQLTDSGHTPDPPSDASFVGYVSMTQDLMRRSGQTEAHWINGEIVRLGAANGVPTPLNQTLQELVEEVARDRAGAGTHTLAELRAEVDARIAARV